MTMTNSDETKEIRELSEIEEQTDIEAAGLHEEPEQIEEPSIIYTFRIPYRFEGTDYTELDLSGITKLNTRDAEWLDRMMKKAGHAVTNKWHDTTYLKLIAQRATGFPIDFFNRMPMKDFIEIGARIQSYFLYM